MRPLLLRTAFLPSLVLALSFAATLSAQYVRDSSSAQYFQKQLEADGIKFRDAIRAQRNTPIPRSNSESTSDWLKRMQAAEEARSADRDAARQRASEQRRDEAEWREKRRRADAEEEAAKAAAAALAAKNARYEAERAAAPARAWNEYRTRNNNYTARDWPPHFVNSYQAVAWYRDHDRTTPNPWAASSAALLLIDGIGLPADPVGAARLIVPHTRPDASGTAPLPEPRALLAYLRVRFANEIAPLGFPADAGGARRDLEALAPSSEAARWFLARVLAESPASADQQQALQYLPDSHAWALQRIGEFLNGSTDGYYTARQALTAQVRIILKTTAPSLPVVMATWSDQQFEHAAKFLLLIPDDEARTVALTHFAEGVVTRYLIPSSPPAFPQIKFYDPLRAAAINGSSFFGFEF